MRKRILSFLGAVQVQYSNSMTYVSVASVTMMALTFWATAGMSIIGSVFPWMGAREFLGFVALGLICVMVFDRFVMYPHRQAFLNKQSYRYENPAVEDLHKLLSDMKKIKKALGIEEDE